MSNKKKNSYKSLTTTPDQLLPNSKKNSYDKYNNSKKFPGLPSSSTYNNLKLIAKDTFAKLENKQFKKLSSNNFPKYTQILSEITKKSSMPSKNKNESEVLGTGNVKMKLSKMIPQNLSSNNATYHLLEMSNTNPNLPSYKDNHFNHFNSLKKQNFKFNNQQNFSQQKLDLFGYLDQSDNENSIRKKSGFNLSHEVNEENNLVAKNNNKQDTSKIKIKINCENSVAKNNYINGGYMAKYPLTPKDCGKIKILTTDGNIPKKLETNRKSNDTNPLPAELIKNRNSFFFQNKNAMPSSKENSTLKDGFTISTINETKIKKGKISIDSNGSNNQNGDKKNEGIVNNIPEEIHFFYVNMIQNGKSLEKKGIQGE